MKDQYLEITYRKGRPMAAYLYLPRPAGAKSERVEQVGSGILVDYGADGLPIGLEITAPSLVSVDGINNVLVGLGQPPVRPEDLSPLAA